jgi:GT2 family glycosyltransferase
MVVDNESSRRTAAIVNAASGRAPFSIRYVDPGSNRGPAGAMRIAMEIAAAEGGEEDWLLRMDDDRPIEPPDLVERLLKFALEVSEMDSMVGAVGLAGSRLDVRTGRLIKPPLVPGRRWAHVDYLATNYVPLFRLAGVRHVGPFREDLFFGWTEVEYGLRLRRAGFNLYRYDESVNARTPSSRTVRMSAVDWRRYYSIRNQVYVLRAFGHPWAGLKAGCLGGVVKPLLNIPIRPRLGLAALRLGARGVSDGWRGRLGMRVDPADWLDSEAEMAPT